VNTKRKSRATPDTTVLDAEKQVCRCTKCGDEVPIPLGVVEWVVGYLNAFVKAHRRCNTDPRPGRTRVSVRDAKESTK